ncbi:MAG: hypothetical protein E5V52_07940 [Mesorhizobium sp.]|nr:MAG: hypothetical protein EOS59_32420 [Mesorhizobium sp.]RWD64062.1 MAG: hypothetical protein EOS60_29765 [Mesorhizobium sp.]TIU42798.1 MAG: hypothetical protein E5W26_00775 [Mesorhizobium sp.]TIV62314.1 MAG: hypothetical protein E5V80_00070 [Mesorhizobium sp.]TIW85580.1 MAG: hypothetical protein E5V52_07940 [Mesorhizobium sp.]
MSFLPGCIDPSRQKSDLRQPSAGKRSRQKLKATSVTLNNERQRHQIEQKVVDRMCERIRPWFELKQQGARLFDRGRAIVCVYPCVKPVKDLQAPSLSPSHTQPHRTPPVSEFSTKEHGRVSRKGIARQSAR